MGWTNIKKIALLQSNFAHSKWTTQVFILYSRLLIIQVSRKRLLKKKKGFKETNKGCCGTGSV